MTSNTDAMGAGGEDDAAFVERMARGEPYRGSSGIDMSDNDHTRLVALARRGAAAGGTMDGTCLHRIIRDLQTADTPYDDTQRKQIGGYERAMLDALGIVRAEVDPTLASRDGTAGEAVTSTPCVLASLRTANEARHVEWAAGNDISLSWRGNELAGEVGEACNVLKKLDRERMGLVGSRAAVGQLAEELADVIICADLAAMDCGIDLGAAVVAKFNATSEARGLVTRIDAHPAPAEEARRTGLLRAAEGEHGERISDLRLFGMMDAYDHVSVEDVDLEIELARDLYAAREKLRVIRAEADKIPAAPVARDAGEVTEAEVEAGCSIYWTWHVIKDGWHTASDKGAARTREFMTSVLQAAARVRPSPAVGAVEAAVLAERDDIARLADALALEQRAKLSSRVRFNEDEPLDLTDIAALANARAFERIAALTRARTSPSSPTAPAGQETR